MYCPLALRRTLAPLHCGLPPSCTVTRSFFFWPKCRGEGGGVSSNLQCSFVVFCYFFGPRARATPQYTFLWCVCVCVHFLFSVSPWEGVTGGDSWIYVGRCLLIHEFFPAVTPSQGNYKKNQGVHPSALLLFCFLLLPWEGVKDCLNEEIKSVHKICR